VFRDRPRRHRGDFRWDLAFSVIAHELAHGLGLPILRHRRAHSRGRRFVAASGVGAVILSGMEGDDSSFISNVGNLLQGGRGASPPNGNEGTDLPYGAPIPVLRHMRRYAHCARSAASVDTPMNQRNSMLQVVCSISWRSDRTEWNA